MIKKPGEIGLKQEKLVLVLQGLPGVGKSTLALSALSPLHIDCDGKLRKTEIEHRVNAIPLQMDSYDELKHDFTDPVIDDCETIVFDTAGALIKYITPYVIRKNPKNGLSDGIALNMKGWGVLKNEFISCIDYCRFSLNKHVIIVCHMKEQGKKINGEEEYKYIMDVPGSSSVFIEQQADLMCMMEMMGNKRVLGFSPTSHYNAKSAFGVKGIIEVPELKPGEPNIFITNLFNRIDNYLDNNIEKLDAMKIEYEKVMKDIKTLVAGVNNIESIKKVLCEFKNIEFPYNSKNEAWTLLVQRSKEIGYKYNGKTKEFEVIE